jgi:hypothetical protein
MAKTGRAARARRAQVGTSASHPPQAKTRSAGKATASAIQRLWPTPIGVHRYAAAATFNPLLVDAFAQLRAE